MEETTSRRQARGDDPASADTAGGRGTDSFGSDADLAASIHVLIVDDERTVRESCASLLRQGGYRVTACGKGEDALHQIRQRIFHIALIDVYLPGVSGMDLLLEFRDRSPDSLVIMMTGKPSVESSIECLRAGAWDYLSKPFSATQLSILIGRAGHTIQVAREAGQAGATLPKRGKAGGVAVLGNAPAFRRAIELARRVAPTDASVFITGDSGTGKELVAQLIHEQSRRSSRELVAINCAALPEGLLESEMFGHSKGAFTGAIQDKQGLLEAANGGTLFLDELTEMSLGIQAKLLRAIQDGVVRRVGSTTATALVNVRFIAATNRDPHEAMREGHLRKDLYYRLRVVPIHLPPLRERASDIPLLAQHFLMEFWKKHRNNDLTTAPRLTEGALDALQKRPWVGNVRELQNVMEHAVVLLEPGQEVEPDDIPFIEEPSEDGTQALGGGAGGIPESVLEAPYHEARDLVMSEFERTYLAEVIRRADGNMSQAARLAGVDRTTLYRLMQKHLVSREEILAD
jgi:DNA-binding NtrC family response regulator